MVTLATPDLAREYSAWLRERISSRVNIAGRTVEHQLDFVIPLPGRKERLVKLIGSPSPQTAKIISFSWLELREARPDSERIVILNDLRAPDPLETTDAEEERRVSEQTISILRGYSSAVYRWSERDATAFPAQLVETFDPANELHCSGGVSPSIANEKAPSPGSNGIDAHRAPLQTGNLYYGDNKEVLAHLLASGYRGKVDIAYIDPPFDSAADYVRKVTLARQERPRQNRRRNLLPRRTGSIHGHLGQ